MVRKKKGEPYITIVEDGCCQFSNVFVRLDEPDNNFTKLADVDGFHVYIRNTIAPLYHDTNITLHALKKIDDSFSAETEFGYKITISYPETSFRITTPQEIQHGEQNKTSQYV